MKKYILIVGFLVLTGCSSEIARWEDAGTLVSVKPAEELTRSPGRLGTALGEHELGLTQVETTKGTYIVDEKISVSQVGTPVRVGYAKQSSSDSSQDMPSFLSFGGHKYKIAR